MFGLGPTELIVILIIALLVLGPKRLPDLATGLGKAIRKFRSATRDLRDQMEVDDSVRQPIQELRAALRDEPSPIRVTPMPPPVGPVAVDKPAPIVVEKVDQKDSPTDPSPGPEKANKAKNSAA